MLYIGGRLREVVAHECSTVIEKLIMLDWSEHDLSLSFFYGLSIQL